MKRVILLSTMVLFLASCTKTETGATQTSNTESSEIALLQEPLKLKNLKGEEISVIYFSEGDVVAVKIQKAGADEQKLSAKTVNPSGNPVFTNESYMWEITQDGRAGKLSDKDGNVTEYN